MALPERTAVVIRGLNRKLIDRSREFVQALRVPIRVIYNTDGLSYFQQLHKLNIDWAINLDEDAFVGRCDYLVELVEYMAAENYQFCGMPENDGWFRRYHPGIPNAFFNVLHVARIKERGDWARIMRASELVSKHHKLQHIELYYSYFIGIRSLGARFLPLNIVHYRLNGYGHEDPAVAPVTMLKDHLQREMLLHTWYSRDYGRCAVSTARIDEAYEIAKAWVGGKPIGLQVAVPNK